MIWAGAGSLDIFAALSKECYTTWLRQLKTLKRYRPISLVMIMIVIISSLTICLYVWEDSMFSQQLNEASEPLLFIYKGVIDARNLNTARCFHLSPPAFDTLQAIKSSEELMTNCKDPPRLETPCSATLRTSGRCLVR